MTAARGTVSARRWNDPAVPGEGTRILVTRYRPRGVRSEDERWEEWHPDLGPSKALHAAAYGKEAPAIEFAEYRRRYLEEVRATKPAYLVRALRGRVAAGEDVVLLCSSACVDPARCHRTLLAALLMG